MVIIFGMHTSMSVAIVAMTDAKTDDSNFVGRDWESYKKSIVLGSLFLGILIAQMPCCYIASIYNAKRLLCMGLLLSGFLHVLTPFIVKLGWAALVCSRVIEGLLQGTAIPCTHILLARWLPPLKRVRLASLVMSGSQIGIVIAMSISGVLAGSHLGWQSIFYVFGSASAVWAIIFYYVALESSPKYSYEMTTPNLKMEKVPWKRILSSVPVWSLVIVTCGQYWTFYMLLTELPAYMKYIVQVNIEQVGEFLAIPYSIMWILGLLVWWLSDFAHQQTKISVTVIRKTNNIIAMCGPTIAMIILCVVETTDKVVAVAILTMMIALNVGVNCGHQINHMDLSQNFSVAIISVTNTMGNVFSLLAPIICGFIVTEVANIEQWRIVFYITASINLMTNLVFVLFGDVETQLWSELGLQLSRYRDQACRISTITAAYSETLSPLKTDLSIDNKTMK